MTKKKYENETKRNEANRDGGHFSRRHRQIRWGRDILAWSEYLSWYVCTAIHIWWNNSGLFNDDVNAKSLSLLHMDNAHSINMDTIQYSYIARARFSHAKGENSLRTKNNLFIASINNTQAKIWMNERTDENQFCVFFIFINKLCCCCQFGPPTIYFGSNWICLHI